MTLKLTLKYACHHLLRATPPVNRRLQWLQERERDEASQVGAIQEAFLHRTLDNASKRLPAYSHLRGKIPRDNVRSFLRTLPIVDKQTVLDDKEAFYPYVGKTRPWHSLGRTSGSSGRPIGTLRSYDSTLWEQAFWRQHWTWAGWQPGHGQIVLRGDLVAPVERSKPPFWFDDTVGRNLFVSIRHLNKTNIGSIADALNSHGSRMLRAYPSGAHMLAVLASEASLPIRFDAVVTSSESLLPEQRSTIERVFSAKVFDHYGMAERVALAIECEHGSLHVHPYYSFVELVDERGNPNDDEGYVVGTTFHNQAMPLVRYRMTDRVRWARGQCACGRTYPRFEIVEGRYGDALFDPNGNTITATVVQYTFLGVPHIAKAQAAQVAPDVIELRILPKKGFGDAQRDELVQRFRTYVSDLFDVRVKVCEHIALQPSGKYKFVVQEFHATPPATKNKPEARVAQVAEAEQA